MYRPTAILMLLAGGLWACSGASATGKASGSAEFGTEGGSVNANAEASLGSPGETGQPGQGTGAEGWVGADPCGVPDDAPTIAGTADIALVEGDKPDTEYVGTPVATLPAFRVLPGGCSRVFLEMRGNVSVVETRAPGRLSYRISGVSVPVRTNRFDLPTEHFATPVSRIQLVPTDGGAELVIEMRAPAKSKATLRRSPRGMVLSVDFRRAEAPPAEQPAAQLQQPAASDSSASQ